MPVKIEDLQPLYTTSLPFAGDTIDITSVPPELGTMDIRNVLREPKNFHGEADKVHDLVEFGPAFAGLRGTHEVSMFSPRDPYKLLENGIVVLTEHYPEARDLVEKIDRQSVALSEDDRLYKDLGFCRDYLELARHGFSLVNKAAGRSGIPISLERAGLVTTRIANGLDIVDENTGHLTEVPDEVRVVTKRAHHRDGSYEDIMVSVQWRDLSDIARLDGQEVEVIDFVNPASGSSVIAMLLSAMYRGSSPKSVIHKSFMATEQGIAFAIRTMKSADMKGIQPYFYTLGTSRHLTPEYYLVRPGVGDAGDVLCNFLPQQYQY